MESKCIPGAVFMDIQFERFFDVLDVTISSLCDNGHIYIDDGVGKLNQDDVKNILLKGAKYYREYAKKEFKKYDDTYLNYCDKKR